MPAARAPLPVEVVTKIPVRTGLNISTPATTGAITRTVGAQAVQNATSRVTAEVVTNVPSGLKNITPVSFGQKLASFGQGAAKLGTKAATAVGTFFSGTSGVVVGAATAGILAVDAALFASPVGRGSDMVNGVRIGGGSQSKPQPQAQPRTQSKPQPQAQPRTQPQAQPQVQPRTQPQVQPRTQPQIARPQAQAAPIPFQPRSVAVNLPQPRAALVTPSPERRAPVPTESPYPLNIIDLNSYGGVNLNYPIAQKLIEFDGKFNEIEERLQQIPQTFESIIKRAKIETTVTLPTTNEIVAQIPLQLDLSKEIPINLDMNSQLPINLDINSQLPVKLNINSQLPLKTDLSSQIPFNINLSKEIPVAVNLRKEIPLAMGLVSQLPLSVNLNSQLPLSVNLNSQLPIGFNLTKEIPVNIDLRKEVPVNLSINSQLPMGFNLSTILQPDNASSGLKSLQKCCEEIQTALKKKEEMFEGTGKLTCDNETIPYSYRGAGLNGIHQLVKIILDANGKILDKICTLDTQPQPLIEGSGVYDCGTLSPIIYNYSGLGLLGIQNQIDQLFKLDKQILTEVCEIGSLPFPDISGKIEYFDCDHATQTILYSGNGLKGLSQQVEALSTLVNVGVKAACAAGSTVIMPDARYEHFRATRQLQITWGSQYPSQAGSLWHTYLPNPKAALDWCKDFEVLQVTKGDVKGHVEWQNSKIPTGIYCESEEEAYRILSYLVTLSNAIPTLNSFGQPKIVITKGNSSKRVIQQRTLRAVRVAISEIGGDGNVASVKCFTPPPEGCLPIII